MTVDAKFIRTLVAEELHARLGERWFKPGTPRLIIARADNLTDFSIELDCYTDRRYGAYDCSLMAVFKWRKFTKLFRELGDWYNDKFQGTVRSKNKEFARVSFDRIQADFKSAGRDVFWVANERDLDAFISQCVNDLDGEVGAWIGKWFIWSSALETMDAHRNLCGSWRDTAYYCLTEQVHGREAACAWIRGIDATGWPQWLAAQVEYLQSQVCASDLNGRISS